MRNVQCSDKLSVFKRQLLLSPPREGSSGRVRCQHGNAMIETIVALLALSPFIAGIPLLGKQLDVKHKTYDAARYSIWERTVWRSEGASNRKSAEDITLEARDRTLGHPRARMLAVDAVRAQGVTENPLWRDRQQRRLLDYRANNAPLLVNHDERPTPVDIGYFLVPGIAYGEGPINAIAAALQVDHLNLNRRAFARSDVSVALRPVLAEIAGRSRSLTHPASSDREHVQVVHRAAGAVLSDTWSANDESHLRRRVDDLTTNELIEDLELPGRPIAMQALGRGEPLYGEGQYGWDVDLHSRSNALPAAYITRR